MTVNEVNVTCPLCGNDKADFCGFYSESTHDKITKEKIIIQKNHYKCLGCNKGFFVERTDANKHEEFLAK